MTRLLSFFSLCFLVTGALCSLRKINDDLRKDLKNCIDKELFRALTDAAGDNKKFRPLLALPVEINKKFFMNKKFDDTFVDKIFEHVVEKLLSTGAEDTEEGDEILSVLEDICEECKSRDKVKRDFLKRRQALNTMADICYLFKAPVQWLVLTSKALGHEELFREAPILLEHMRVAFIEKFDPKYDPVIFEEKLNFIKLSFDYFFSQIRPQNLATLLVYSKLQVEFFRQIDAIIDDLKKTEDPFVNLDTGLGKEEMEFNVDLGVTSKNEDLWGYIIYRIELLRSMTESCCPNLIALHKNSIIDEIITIITLLSESSIPFTLKKAHEVIVQGFDKFFSLIENPINHERFGVDILFFEIGKVKELFEMALSQFKDEIEIKIDEIRIRHEIEESESANMDLSIVAVAAMAHESLKIGTD